jgi:6-phospho-beta-glucosidase
MKIAIIGGASVRTPLLAHGLVDSDLPISEIALYDVDRARLSTISAVAGDLARGVRAYDDPRACMAGAAFVVFSIRAGGIERRAHDEAAAMALGVVGQETVGPAGFAMALRNIGPLVEYAQVAAEVAPHAWIVNFTNPVGIVTQAIALHASNRVIGICDTPTELFEAVAAALDADSSRCRFDYFGLNHLGWLREVYVDGVPRLASLLHDPRRLEHVYSRRLFEPAFLHGLGLVPTEYLFYYYRPDVALENSRRAGATRGQAIAALNEQLFRDLAGAGRERRVVYEQYLQRRSASYMQIEAGGAPASPAPWTALTGYDKIALHVIRAIHHNLNAIIPLNVRNTSAIPELESDDVVEVPCVVNANGAQPLAVGAVPAAVRELLIEVKAYERLTVAAAGSRSTVAAISALAHNPLVADEPLARRLVAALEPLW